jgi:hypothetical protein
MTMGNVFPLVLGVTAVVMFEAIIKAPRWFARSLHRHRLWHLRDAIVDDILGGVLSPHPAVFAFLDKVETVIENADRFTYLDIALFGRLRAGLSPQARGLSDAKADRGEDWPPLSRDDKICLAAYEGRFDLLLSGLVLIGSWSGVFKVLSLLPSALRTVAHQQSRTRRAIVVATDRAADPADGREAVRLITRSVGSRDQPQHPVAV